MILNCKRVHYLVELETTPLPHWAARHVKGCANCQAFLREHGAYQGILHTVKIEPAPTSRLEWSQMRAHLQERQQIRRTQPRFHQWAWAMPVTATLIIGAFIGRLALTGDLKSAEPVRAPYITESKQKQNSVPDITFTSPSTTAVEETTKPVSVAPPSDTESAARNSRSIVAVTEANSMPTSIVSGREGSKLRGDLDLARGSLTEAALIAELSREIPEVIEARSDFEGKTNFGTDLAYHWVGEEGSTNALPLPSIQTRADSAQYLEVRITEDSNDAHSF